MTETINSVRRVTYPAAICVRAWLYAHGLAFSKFSSHTYLVFVYLDQSYSNLYSAVQAAFDHLYSGVQNDD